MLTRRLSGSATETVWWIDQRSNSAAITASTLEVLDDDHSDGTRRRASLGRHDVRAHTALSGKFGRAFGSDCFEPVWPNDLMYCCVDEEKAKDWFEGRSKIAPRRENIERIPDNSAGICAPETIRGELYKTDKQLPHELYARPLADNIPIGNVL